MALPELYHVDRVRKLAGDALITFPTADPDVRRIERVYRIDRGEALPVYLSADKEYATAKLVERTIVGGDQQHVEVFLAWEDIPGTLLSGVAISGEANGAFATTTTQVLAQSAANYTPTWRTLAYSDVPIDANRKRRTVVELEVSNDTFPVLTEYDQDPVLQYLIVTTYQIVPTSSVSAPSPSVGFITRYKKIDIWRSMKIVENHLALLSKTYSEQRFDAASFPTLWDVSQFSWTTACGTFSTERDGFSTMVESRVDVSFTTSKQTISGLQIIPNSLHLGRNVQFTNILNDAGSVTYFDSCDLTVSFGASDPSLAAYNSLVSSGTPQLITGESVLFRAGIYRNTKLYRRMQ